MTLWFRFATALFGFLSRAVAYLEARRNRKIGRREEEDRIDAEISDAIDRIHRANPDRVRDDIFNDPSAGDGPNVRRPEEG